MHDIWNPWHGCIKCSEGCLNCYMYFLDRVHNKNGADIYRTRTGFDYPLQKYKNGEYKLAGGLPEEVPEDAPFFLKDYFDYYKKRAYHKDRLFYQA